MISFLNVLEFCSQSTVKTLYITRKLVQGSTPHIPRGRHFLALYNTRWWDSAHDQNLLIKGCGYLDIIVRRFSLAHISLERKITWVPHSVVGFAKEFFFMGIILEVIKSVRCLNFTL